MKSQIVQELSFFNSYSIKLTKKRLCRNLRTHIKGNCRVELSLICVKFTSHRGTLSTDGVTCRFDIYLSSRPVSGSLSLRSTSTSWTSSYQSDLTFPSTPTYCLSELFQNSKIIVHFSSVVSNTLLPSFETESFCNRTPRSPSTLPITPLSGRPLVTVTKGTSITQTWLRHYDPYLSHLLRWPILKRSWPFPLPRCSYNSPLRLERYDPLILMSHFVRRDLLMVV